MIAAIRSEYRKLITTRMWWILAIILGVIVASMSLMLSLAFTIGGEDELTAGMVDFNFVRTMYTIAPSLGYIFPLLIGTMAFTQEFRHQTITPTFLADTSRTRVLISKMLANLIVGAIYGVIGVVCAVVPAAIAFSAKGYDTQLSSATTWRDFALTVLAMAIWAMVGVGFGTLVKNQIAAIVVVIAFNQLVEPLARMALASFDLTRGVAKFLPGAAGESLSGGSSLYSGLGMASLDWWQGGIVLLAYAVVFAIIGRLWTLRRDIT